MTVEAILTILAVIGIYIGIPVWTYVRYYYDYIKPYHEKYGWYEGKKRRP